ncbi:hypothetical protein NQ314_005868 [Rhamnusium bicolor]|nr:hypothetical protein NQ314_005868 [Rhamnusium bicolor]
MDAKWSTDVVSHAYRTLNERKWNQPKRLPLARDIQKLNSYLLTRAQSLYETLQTSQDIDSFKELTEITLVMTVILNRRRVGEVQYMKLTDYEKAKTADTDSDVFGVLTDAEKQLSKSLVRLVVRGKKGRGVPVLLTEKLQNCVSVLINLRFQCGVLPTNPYLFPSLRHTSGFYPAHRLINQFSVKAGCEAPQNITSTKLRKHIAVMVQLLNLKENELDSLAQFKGHDIRVHRQYYRLQDETVQLAKISKILLNMEKGNLNIMKGKSLDEIEVNEEISDNEEDEEEELDLTSILPDLSVPGMSTKDFATNSVSTSVINVTIPHNLTREL